MESSNSVLWSIYILQGIVFRQSEGPIANLPSEPHGEVFRDYKPGHVPKMDVG